MNRSIVIVKSSSRHAFDRSFVYSQTRNFGDYISSYIVLRYSSPVLMAIFTPISTPISPFAKPEAPPPPVIVLLDATELHFHIHSPTSLLAFEDLRPSSFKISPNRTPAQRARFHPYNCQEDNVSLSPGRQPTPRPTPRTTSQPPVSPPTDSSAMYELADTSPLSSPASSLRSTPVPDEIRHVSFGVVSTKIKIERPKGAARKNLQTQVKWDTAFMADVKVLYFFLLP